MLDYYFKTLNSDLKHKGLRHPQLIVDDAALQQNIQYIQTKIVQAEQLKPRLAGQIVGQHLFTPVAVGEIEYTAFYGLLFATYPVDIRKFLSSRSFIG